MTTRVLRWVVPVDDKPHPIGAGKVVMVATRVRDGWHEPGHTVEVWTEEHLPPEWPKADPPLRTVQVFGTGHEIPSLFDKHVGSCLDAITNGSLVWHVYGVT